MSSALILKDGEWQIGITENSFLQTRYNYRDVICK
jgi:hypothetical protein